MGLANSKGSLALGGKEAAVGGGIPGGLSTAAFAIGGMLDVGLDDGHGVRCVCVCMRTFILIHIHVCIHIYVCIHVYVCIHMYYAFGICMYIHVYVCAWLCIYIHIYAKTYVCM